MLRGNYPARIDEKGRLKIPVPFKEELERTYGGEFWITSPTGQFAWIYPLEEWKKIEEGLLHNVSSTQVRRKFLERTNYYGQVVRWDKQGRLLMPTVLRDAAEMKGDVAVLGNLTYLTVWNNERYLADIRDHPITDEDLNVLGI